MKLLTNLAIEQIFNNFVGTMASLAQQEEHQIVALRVTGSNPVARPK